MKCSTLTALLLAGGLLLVGPLQAQDTSDEEAQDGRHEVSGTVTDAATEAPLPGVNVVVKGTSRGAATGPLGSYTLTAPSPSDTLVYSFVGYEPSEVPIAGRSVVDVALEARVIEGEELVVTGYQEQRKADLTGAVSVVDTEELQDVPVDNPVQSLQGRVPGLSVNDGQLNTPARTDQLVIAAYAALGNDYWAFPYSNMWPYGSVRSDNAYKGGGGTADQDGYDIYEQFAFIRTDQEKADQMWTHLYQGVSRANEALRRVQQFSEEDYPEKATRQAEMRFLRGHFHFLLKILFKHVPYITEDISRDSLNLVSNRAYTSQALWDKIEEDFRFAAETLPATQPEVGRADASSAKAYLAKTLLYSAYEQDEQHQVVNIDLQELQD